MYYYLKQELYKNSRHIYRHYALVTIQNLFKDQDHKHNQTVNKTFN